MRNVRPRFTVKRMMVAVAILAVIFQGVVLVSGSRASALHDECRNNLKQIGLGLLNYHDANMEFPRGTLSNEGLPPEKRLSWYVDLWCMIQQFFVIFDRSEPWDSRTNLAPMHCDSEDTEPPHYSPVDLGKNRLLVCPADSSRAAPGMPCTTSYVGIAGLGTDAPGLLKGHPRAGVFGHDRQTRIADIVDGASQTMLVAETTAANGPWTAGGPATVRGLDPARQPYIGAGRQFGGSHADGAMVLFADGSVRFTRGASPRVFEAISTIAGNEIIPPTEY